MRAGGQYRVEAERIAGRRGELTHGLVDPLRQASSARFLWDRDPVPACLAQRGVSGQVAGRRPDRAVVEMAAFFVPGAVQGRPDLLEKARGLFEHLPRVIARHATQRVWHRGRDHIVQQEDIVVDGRLVVCRHGDSFLMNAIDGRTSAGQASPRR